MVDKLKSKSQMRESNFELLRLVCMFYIILHHFIFHGLVLNNEIKIILNGFFIVGVNCFVLISGYFGIKTNWKTIIQLYVICLFYSLISACLMSWKNDTIHLWKIANSFLPFSHTKYWFILQYFYLFLLAPLLNKFIENSTKKGLFMLISVFGVFSFYFGYVWKNSINEFGYSFMNFIFLYLIGRFIALYVSNNKATEKRRRYLITYAISSIIIGSIGIVIFHMGLNKELFFKYVFPYNSPLVVLSSVSFFLFFRTLNIQSKIINWLSASSLSIYLIHESEYVRVILYEYVAKLNGQIENGIILAFVLLFFAVIIIFSCIFIDKIRMIITRPIEKLLMRIDWDGYTSKFIGKITSLIK